MIGYRAVHTLDSPDDLERIVAKEDVVYLLLYSRQDSEIIVSKKKLVSFYFN